MSLGLGYGAEPRAAFAVQPARSRGRYIAEPESPTRTAFQRDRDRIVHCTAFRRLKFKTQVFIFHEGDHYRTRLTHTIEVAQIARALARALRLDEDLAEALALAHDLGHTPFGHEGEDVLNDCMADHGGFDHNAQSLRIVTHLEHRYAEFDGLNLSWETLEGLVKHNGPLTDKSGAPIGRYKNSGLPHAIKAYSPFQDLLLWSRPSAEAQAAAIADDIAYDAHDIDDGLRAGLFGLDDLAELPVVGDILDDINNRYPGLEPGRQVHELVRRLITQMVEDVLSGATKAIAELAPQSADDIRFAKNDIFGFSKSMREADKAIKRFLFQRVYRHAQVLDIRAQAGRVVRDLYDAFTADYSAMPDEWQVGLDDNPHRIPRRVCDYIAGMTDRYAMSEHARLFDDTPELR